VRYNALNQMTAKNLGAGKHADGQGLWLVKREKAFGKWVLRVAVHGSRREMGLGRWPDVSIGEARELAEGARKLVRVGNDPIADRRRAKRVQAVLTVREAVEGCFDARKAELKRDGEAGRWMSPLSVHILPKLGKLPVEELDQHLIKETLDVIWHKKPEAAEKALNRLSLTLKHAAALGLDVDLQATMKARALMGKQRRTTEHIPSMPYEDAPAFYQRLKAMEGVSPVALRFLMLTLGRTSEVRLATFDEIAADVWLLTAERRKVGPDFRIPLSAEALRLVKERRRASSNACLFPAYKGQPLSDAAMAKVMKNAGLEARPHGFRATFRTWAEEQSDAAFELKEACLGHAVDTGVVGAYQRSDRLVKRRALMTTWAEFLTKS
jgi:integrase